MSHRWDCPTRWEAERQGARDADRGAGRYSNPYDRYHGNHCPEAERAWEDGHRAEERRAEERRDEERAERQREHMRRQQEYEWQMEEDRAAYEREQADAMAAEQDANSPPPASTGAIPF